MNCTCAHICHGGIVLHHDWQLQAWREKQEYVPCTTMNCSAFYHCGHPVTQEDMLCDWCREAGCVSFLSTNKVRNLLVGHIL